MKTCSCCRRAISAREWAQLRLVGHQVDDVETLEMRDCPCGSTLAIVLAPAIETVSPEAETAAIREDLNRLVELIEASIELAIAADLAGRTTVRSHLAQLRQVALYPYRRHEGLVRS